MAAKYGGTIVVTLTTSIAVLSFKVVFMCILISCEAGGTLIPAHLTPSPSMRFNSTPDNGVTALQERASEQEDRTPVQRDNVNPVNQENVTRPDSLAPPNLAADQAALYAAHRMSQRLGAPLIQYQFSLSAIDVTRSLRHPKLFSARTRSLPASDRQRLIDEYYVPYRDAIKSAVTQLLQRYTYVLHLSVRSFDSIGPKKKRRRADVGLLYDPSSSDEADLCADWLYELYYEAEMLKVRRNYPRRGTVDSLIKAMRAEFSGQSYLGIELLLNRAWAGRSIQVRDNAIDHLCNTLGTTMQLPQNVAA